MMQAGAVSTCRSRPSAVTQPANKQKKIPFETGLASLHHWHALQARRTFSAAGVECKLNRAALGVNFTCISVAISACGTWPPAGTGAVREGGAMALSPELLMQHSLTAVACLVTRKAAFHLTSSLPRSCLTHSESCDWCPNPKLISFRASFTLAWRK